MCFVQLYITVTNQLLFWFLTFKGYHDVAVTLLLVVGEDLATALLEQLSLHQLRYFLLYCFEHELLNFQTIENSKIPELKTCFRQPER